MTKLEDKFWDTAITEAATGKRPPDQADRILQRLRKPEAAEPADERQAPKGRRLQMRRVLEISAAAAALIAIGILTGLIPFGEDGPDNGTGPDPAPRMIAAAPGTEYETRGNQVELKDGWLLVTTGAPEVHCEGSTLSGVDGRVLVHAGSMPSGVQAESVADWLKANGLELEMITQVKRWVQGAGLAALVLTGSALLDGARIEAQEETLQSEPKWFGVSSVMDIQKLPDDATHVYGLGLDGAHLEFLAEHGQILHLDADGLRNVRAEQVDALHKLKNLEVLNLSAMGWTGAADYSGLLKLERLKSLSIDYLPADNDGKEVNFVSNKIRGILKDLSERGVELTLTGLGGVDGEQLGWISANLKGVESLNLGGNKRVGDADLRVLQQMSDLRVLDLRECPEIDELGLAYVSKIKSLRHLLVTAEATDPMIYQLAHMDQLEALYVELSPWRVTSGLKSLARLPNLVRLTVIADVHLEAAAEIRNFANIERLELKWGAGYGGFKRECELLTLYGITGVRSMELSVDRFNMQSPDAAGIPVRDELAGIKESDSLREITLTMAADEFDAEVERPIIAVKLSKFTGLKKVHVKYYHEDHESPDAFIAYMKEILAKYEVQFQLDE